MADIEKQTLSFATAVTQTELTGADVLVSTTGTLWINNLSGVSATINLDGEDGTDVSTIGQGVIDVSGGYDIVVADGELVTVSLANISSYLNGTVNVTGGTADVFAFVI